MDSLSNRQKILKWLSENKIIVEDEEKIDDDSLKAISLCIEYYNQIDKNEKKHRNDLVDEEDELVDIYSDYNFNGKIGVPISHKKDIIKSIVFAIIGAVFKLDGLSGLKNIVIEGALSFFQRIVILPDNEQRCIFLRVLILSDNQKNEVTLEQIKKFVEEENYTRVCPFAELYTCKKINMEQKNLCSGDVYIEKILKELNEKKVLSYDETKKKVLVKKR